MPPQYFYDGKESKKYNSSSRIVKIQNDLAERAVELLCLPKDKICCLLDVGCGSGLSGEVLERHGHYFVGCDISRDMLDCAAERQLRGDIVHSDMGQGLPFKSGAFDGAVSISAIQWLCYSNSKAENPRHRLTAFFRTLYNSLKRGSRAAIQFYPENSEQLQLITSTAMRCGFTGGVVVDYPNSAKAKKFYLCLTAGVPLNSTESSRVELPKALGTDDDNAPATSARFESRRLQKKNWRRGKKRIPVKSRDWILAKKERQRRQGRNVRRDSKFTGRKRRDRF